MNEARRIANAVKCLLGPHFAVMCEKPRPVDQHLFPEEQAYIAQAAAKRRAEFGTARICARKALLELGIPPAPLVPRADRSPTWPRGVTGSISHTSRWCVVAATTRADVAGVGLDLEEDTPLERNLETFVCTPNERRILARLTENARGRTAKLIFSAKEALYKCQHRTTGVILDFQDMELYLDFAGGNFRISRSAGNDLVRQTLSRIEGRFLWTEGLVIATALLPA